MGTTVTGGGQKGSRMPSATSMRWRKMLAIADAEPRFEHAHGELVSGELFPTISRVTGALTSTPLPQPNAHAMIRRRAAAAGVKTLIGNHSFRGTPW